MGDVKHLHFVLVLSTSLQNLYLSKIYPRAQCWYGSHSSSFPPHHTSLLFAFFLRPRSDFNSHKAPGEGLSCGVTGWDFWSLGFNILLPLLSFINSMFLDPGLSYSLHLCLRHVGGWFLTHGPMCSSDNGGPVSVCVLSCSLPGILERWCHSTPTHLFYTHTHYSHQYRPFNKLPLISTCFQKRVLWLV